MKAELKNIIAMIIFGTIGIFVRYISLSSGEIALFRALIASIIIMIYKFIKEKKISFGELKRDILFLFLFLSGVAIGFNWILLFEAYKYTTVSIATLSYYFAPVIVMVVCPILFKERITIKQIMYFIMATIGLIMVINVKSIDKSNNIGIAFGLGAAVLYAAVIILNKFIKNVTGIDRTLIQFIAAIIVLLPYILGTTGINIGSLKPNSIISLLILGIIHTGFAYCLYFSSLKDLEGQEAAILSYIDPLVAIIISLTILGEEINLLQIIGGLIILSFTLLNEINSNNKERG